MILMFSSVFNFIIVMKLILFEYPMLSYLYVLSLIVISNMISIYCIQKYVTYFCNLFIISIFCPLNSIGLIFIVICLALSTNFSVFIVSSILLADGEIFPTINVYVFPISDYCNKRVSFDSLKAAILFVFDDNEAMTFPKVESD